MHDYTGTHDYFNEAYVSEWTMVANSKRPFRARFFDTFVSELAILRKLKVLDVGSGPGFLAERVLAGCDVASYHLFDFSPHMLELSRVRLRDFGERAVFHQGSFLDEEWWQSLPAPFDAIVSMQAIHEVRDSARIPKLYGELKLLLRVEGIILIADEVNDGDKNEEHLLSLSEHEAALLKAGFERFRRVYAAGDLVMFAATRRRSDRA
jgi:SAM-dependent methyltransferase